MAKEKKTKKVTKKKRVSKKKTEDAPVAVISDTPEGAPAPDDAQKTISLEDLKEGFVVGITAEGDFVFNILGQTTLVGLLGLGEHAKRQIRNVYNQRQGLEDALVLELHRAVGGVLQKTDAILNFISPKRPDNTL